MIEDVERFRPEFKILAFGNREVLDQCHVEIRAPGITENVSPSISESESGGQHEHIWIVEKRTEARQLAC